MKQIVFMFSGQGAQYYQMGRELFDTDPVFRRWMRTCDALARPVIGADLTEIIYGNTLAESAGFDRLLHTHPALLAQGYSLAQALKCRGIEPDYVLGYSLGELIGAVFAGAISLQDGFALVLEQARLVERTTPPARMVAVLNRPELMQEHPKLCYRKLRQLERALLSARRDDQNTSSALGQLFAAGAGGLFEALGGSGAPNEGQRHGR
jgi:bacillaene synthase trans-acting acyltransferase/trans-AT polyketide synthase/acyltransferase/oxidoreductase domain-containing protein